MEAIQLPFALFDMRVLIAALPTKMDAREKEWADTQRLHSKVIAISHLFLRKDLKLRINGLCQGEWQID